MSVTLYIPMVFVQGSDEWDEFEAAAYPEREGMSLGFPDKDAATAYLAQRVPDEMPDLSDDEIMTLAVYPSLHEGGCQAWHETEQYVAVWDAGYCLAALWLKEQTTVRESTEHTGHPPVWPNYIDSSDVDDMCECGESDCIFCVPGA